MRVRDTDSLCEIGIVLERIQIVIALDVSVVISLDTQSFGDTICDVDVAHEVVCVACVDVIASYHAEVAFDNQSVVEQLCRQCHLKLLVGEFVVWGIIDTYVEVL